VPRSQYDRIGQDLLAASELDASHLTVLHQQVDHLAIESYVTTVLLDRITDGRDDLGQFIGPDMWVGIDEYLGLGTMLDQ
jgi:hypothetical protein